MLAPLFEFDESKEKTDLFNSNDVFVKALIKKQTSSASIDSVIISGNVKRQSSQRKLNSNSPKRQKCDYDESIDVIIHMNILIYQIHTSIRL